jgi:hypothetical protein
VLDTDCATQPSWETSRGSRRGQAIPGRLPQMRKIMVEVLKALVDPNPEHMIRIGGESIDLGVQGSTEIGGE